MNQTLQEEQVRAYYRTLFRTWGRQHWWPARTRFEVIVGAYLTQNTSWRNVELALGRLRRAGVLNPEDIRLIPLPKLESLVRPAGYYRQKARRLKIFSAFLDQQYGGSLQRMFAQPAQQLRRQLLELNGVGPETADSILLYAGQHPIFVVDAYTRRVLGRHEILPVNAPYGVIQDLFHRALGSSGFSVRPAKLRTGSSQLRSEGIMLPHRPSAMSRAKRSPLSQVYNDLHGLIVALGKSYCVKSRPHCDECPLKSFLPRQGTPK